MSPASVDLVDILQSCSTCCQLTWFLQTQVRTDTQICLLIPRDAVWSTLTFINWFRSMQNILCIRTETTVLSYYAAATHSIPGIFNRQLQAAAAKLLCPQKTQKKIAERSAPGFHSTSLLPYAASREMHFWGASWSVFISTTEENLVMCRVYMGAGNKLRICVM